MTAEGFPSTTARRVAAHRLGFDRPATPYGEPAADDRMAADVAGSAAVDLNESMNRRELRALAALSTQLAMSAATTASSRDRVARRRRFQRAVAAVGEPVRNSLTGEQMTRLLGATGWRVRPGSDRARQGGLLSAEPA